MKPYDPYEFRPMPRKRTWRDWDGWLLVAWLSFAILCAVYAVVTGAAQ